MKNIEKYLSLLTGEVDGLLLTSRYSRHYVAEFDIAEGVAIVTKAGCRYFTDSRYIESAENGIQGRVTLSFVVERDGSIAQIEVMRSPAEELSKESIRVVQTMPKWKPGKQRGKAVRVKYVLPITFRLS